MRMNILFHCLFFSLIPLNFYERHVSNTKHFNCNYTNYYQENIDQLPISNVRSRIMFIVLLNCCYVYKREGSVWVAFFPERLIITIIISQTHSLWTDFRGPHCFLSLLFLGLMLCSLATGNWTHHDVQVKVNKALHSPTWPRKQAKTKQ